MKVKDAIELEKRIEKLKTNLAAIRNARDTFEEAWNGVDYDEWGIEIKYVGHEIKLLLEKAIDCQKRALHELNEMEV